MTSAGRAAGLVSICSSFRPTTSPKTSVFGLELCSSDPLDSVRCKGDAEGDFGQIDPLGRFWRAPALQSDERTGSNFAASALHALAKSQPFNLCNFFPPRLLTPAAQSRT